MNYSNNRTHPTPSHPLAMRLLLGLVFASSPLARAVTYQAVEGACEVVVKGTSSLHDWEMKSAALPGTLVLEKAVANQEELAGLESLTSADKNPTLQLTVGAETLKSEKKKMDDKAYAALDTGAHPNITFALKTAQAKADAASKQPLELALTGTLALVGKEKEIAFTAQTQVLADGKIELKGEVHLKMTDFGMKPPTALLGALKTGDDITVSFVWVVAPQK